MTDQILKSAEVFNLVADLKIVMDKLEIDTTHRKVVLPNHLFNNTAKSSCYTSIADGYYVGKVLDTHIYSVSELLVQPKPVVLTLEQRITNLERQLKEKT